MYKVLCLNKISPVGTKRFGEAYTFSPEMENPQGILVRSASMHDMELGENLLAIARAGAGGEQHPGGRLHGKGHCGVQHPRRQRQRCEGAGAVRAVPHLPEDCPGPGLGEDPKGPGGPGGEAH